MKEFKMIWWNDFPIWFDRSSPTQFWQDWMKSRPYAGTYWETAVQAGKNAVTPPGPRFAGPMVQKVVNGPSAQALQNARKAGLRAAGKL